MFNESFNINYKIKYFLAFLKWGYGVELDWDGISKNLISVGIAFSKPSAMKSSILSAGIY